MAISAQPVELFALTWACILNRDKTGNAYTNSSILLEWLMMLGYCRSNMTSLLQEEEKKIKRSVRSFSHFLYGSFVFLVLTCSRMLIYFGN